MPRKYVRKSLRATSYTSEEVVEAIEKVKRRELTLFAAAKRYEIPIATLHNRLNKKTRVKSETLGRPPVFSHETEMRLANGLKILEKWGFGLSRKEVIFLVERYVRLNNIHTPFKDGVPGPDWFTNFRIRHGLSLKKAQSLEHARKRNTDPFIIHQYFQLLKSTLNDLNLEQRPHLIWNLDETSVCLDPSKTKVVGKKGAPSSRTTNGTGKENITVLTAISANAKKINPLIIFKGKFVWDSWMAETAGKYNFQLSYAASQRGWMDTEIFYNYMKKVFIPALGNERPVLLVYDGHGSHVDLKVVELAIQNNITILKLPPHTSHILQPLDVAVFKSFKSRWDSKLVEWQRQNTGVKVPKNVFSELFAEVWNDTKDQIILNGFKKAGIHPFNSEVVSIDKFDPRAYKRWEETQMNDSKSLQQQYQYPSKDDTLHSLPLHVDAQFSQRDAPLQVQSTQTLGLKELCIDAINVLMYDNILFEFENTSLAQEVTSVHLLADASKYKEETQAFIANQEKELPTCLKSKNLLKEKVSTSKTALHRQNPNINIISNEVVSFEELLLETVKQSPRHDTKTKKRRIALGADVITESMKKHLYDKTTQNILGTKIEIPKKKTPKESIIVEKRMNRNDDIIKIKKELYTQKSEVIKEKQQKKKLRDNVQRKRKHLMYSDTESSEYETEVVTIETDDSDCENMDEYIEKYLKEHEDQENEDPCANIPLGLSELLFYDNNSTRLKKDDWLVVQFATKKNVKHYVGIILSIDNQIPMVKYVRKVKQSFSDTLTSFTYPTVEDVSAIKHKEDIVCILPQPTISRRGQIRFEVDLKKYNIQ